MTKQTILSGMLGAALLLVTAQVVDAGHRDCDYGYSIGPLNVPRYFQRSTSRASSSFGYRYDRPVTRTNPYWRYRYGDPPYGVGNFYRDRQGFFFYGLDDRYRFGIHR